MTVFVVADIPVTATNGQYANVQLAATATAAGTGTRRRCAQTARQPDTAGVDIVFGDGGAVARNGIHEAADQYAIQSAALTVTKTAAVISDPFNLTSNPKAIPGAVVRVHDHRDQQQHDDGGGVGDRDRPDPDEHHVSLGQLTLDSAALTDDGTDSDQGESSPRRRAIVVTPARWPRTAARRRSRSRDDP